MLALVGLAGYGERMPSQLSGGQQQRVALARVLATDPRVLLFDEPLSALDKNLRDTLKYSILELQRRTGKTAIYVTHDQSEAFAISDRIVVMNAGRAEQIGTQTEIYLRPETPFVAEFIGANNALAGSVAAIDGTGDDARAVVDVGGLQRSASRVPAGPGRRRPRRRVPPAGEPRRCPGGPGRPLRERRRGRHRAGDLRRPHGSAARRRRRSGAARGRLRWRAADLHRRPRPRSTRVQRGDADPDADARHRDRVGPNERARCPRAASRRSSAGSSSRELPLFVHRPYLVVTMADLWPRFEAQLTGHAGRRPPRGHPRARGSGASRGCPAPGRGDHRAGGRPGPRRRQVLRLERAACRCSRSRPRPP